MERYLKDEPKNQTFKKIPENARCSWYEVRSLEDFTDHRLDGLSSSSSPMSWDGALSCAVLVKQVGAHQCGHVLKGYNWFFSRNQSTMTMRTTTPTIRRRTRCNWGWSLEIQPRWRHLQVRNQVPDIAMVNFCSLWKCVVSEVLRYLKRSKVGVIVQKIMKT